jgi:hypothetical protein
MVAAVEQIVEGRIGFETDGSEHDGMVGGQLRTKPLTRALS